jgi:hypothetical protein
MPTYFNFADLIDCSVESNETGMTLSLHKGGVIKLGLPFLDFSGFKLGKLYYIFELADPRLPTGIGAVYYEFTPDGEMDTIAKSMVNLNLAIRKSDAGDVRAIPVSVIDVGEKHVLIRSFLTKATWLYQEDSGGIVTHTITKQD